METPATDSTAAAGTPVWRFLLQPKWLLWHVTMVVSFWGMLWMGDWQFRRAMSGNGLSWAYTFEWPLFAVFAVVFWAKTIRDELRIRGGKIPDPKRVAADSLAPGGGSALAGLGIAQAVADDEPEDDELAKYNAYLARLNARAKR